MTDAALDGTSQNDISARPTRRAFLKGVGAAGVLVVGGGVYRATTAGVFASGTGPAFEPWESWNAASASTGPLGIVRAGILAANPHNTQPWLFDVRDDGIDVFADTARNLASFDPYLREMHIGLGCAIENMVLTARAQGYAVDVNLPQGDLTGIPEEPAPNLVARMRLRQGAKDASPLYEAIGERRTNRAAYDATRDVPENVKQAFAQCADGNADIRVFLFADATQRKVLGDATVRATELICEDRTMSHDSHVWFRNTWKELQTLRDGVHVDTAGLSPLIRFAAKMMPPVGPETSNKGWIAGTRSGVDSSPLLGLVAVRNLYDRVQTLEAGRVWQRVHLTATTHGIAMQPVNQVVELVDRDRQLGRPLRMEAMLAELTSDTGWQPTFVFRAGYAKQDVLHSARRPLDDVLLS